MSFNDGGRVSPNPYKERADAWEEGYVAGSNTALQRAHNERDQQAATQVYTELVDRSQVIAWLREELERVKARNGSATAVEERLSGCISDLTGWP